MNIFLRINETKNLYVSTQIFRRFFSSKKTFVDQIVKSETKSVFPDIRAKQLRRGAGGRSSFNGQVVTVFGGGGFVGKYVINKLAKVGAQVIVPFRGDPYECAHLKLCGDLGQIQFVKFDLKNSQSIYNSLKYSNCCVNLVGKDTETNNYDFTGVHVTGARAIARCARELSIQRLIHVSSMNVRPNPEPKLLRRGSQWLRSKYFGEFAVREEFPDSVIIRPADIHGTDDNFTTSFCKWQRRQLHALPMHAGGFGTFKQPVFVGDVAQAIVNAITDDESPGETYEAFGPRRYEMRSLVEYINRIIQKTPEFDFHVTNMRWAPLFKLRVLILSNPKWLRKYPHVSFEKLERESISDIPTIGMKSIEDLGIKLTPIEDKWEENLMHWRRLAYDEEVGEYPELDKPLTVPLNTI